MNQTFYWGKKSEMNKIWHSKFGQFYVLYVKCLGFKTPKRLRKKAHDKNKKYAYKFQILFYLKTKVFSKHAGKNYV